MSKTKSGAPHDPHCTFCRRGLDQVKVLIEGPAEAFVAGADAAEQGPLDEVVVVKRDPSSRQPASR
jgi:hypothetical protein